VLTPLPSISSKNCLQLRRLLIIVGVQDGSLIDDPAQEDNPWTDFMSQLSSLGCNTEHLDIRAKIAQSAFFDRPTAKVLDFISQGIASNPSLGGLEEFVETQRLSARRWLDRYVRILKKIVSPLNQDLEPESRLMHEGIDVVKAIRHYIRAAEAYLSTGRMPDGRCRECRQAIRDVPTIFPRIRKLLDE
jgi:hypothetical protein